MTVCCDLNCGYPHPVAQTMPLLEATHQSASQSNVITYSIGRTGAAADAAASSLKSAIAQSLWHSHDPVCRARCICHIYLLSQCAALRSSEPTEQLVLAPPQLPSAPGRCINEKLCVKPVLSSDQGRPCLCCSICWMRIRPRRASQWHRYF